MHRNEYVLLRHDFFLPEFVVYVSIHPSKAVLVSHDTSRLAAHILSLCSNLENYLRSPLKAQPSTYQGASSFIEIAGDEAEETAFEAARCKQSLLAAVENIVDIFTKIKIEFELASFSEMSNR